MYSESAYVPYYKHLQTCSRINLLVERKSKKQEVWVIKESDYGLDNPIKVKAVAELTPDCKGIHFAVCGEGGTYDFDLDSSNVRTLIKKHHDDKF